MAIRFDTADDRVYIIATLPDPTITGLTVLGWWRVRVSLGDFSAYYRTSAEGSTVNTVATGGTGLGVNIFTPSGEITDTYANAVDEWIGMAVVDDGSGTVTQFVLPAGGAVTSNSGTITTGTPDQLCLAARSDSDDTEWFNGAAAYVRVFADALTQPELEAEWGSPTAVLSAWADWPLVDGIADISGAGRHLTAVTGTPTFEAGPDLGASEDTPARVPVGAVPVSLTPADTGPVGRRVVVRNTNATAANSVSLGGTSSVTAGNGFLLSGGAQLVLPLSSGEELWAVRGGASDVVVHLLRLGD